MMPLESLELSASFWDWAKLTLSFVAAVFALLGGVAAIRSWQINSRLALARADMARREKDANEKAIADAGARAAESIARAEEAKRAAAEANAKAEHERLERLKIERKIAPRGMSLQQFQSIARQLTAYRPDVAIGVFAARQTAEIVEFRDVLIWALHEATWPISAGIKEDDSRAVVGVLIEVRSNADPKDWVRAEALAAVLRGEEIEVFGPSVMENRGFSFRASLEAIETAPIHVIVGEKLLSV